ncbi:HTH domain-containing protein [Halarchaeum nitratireducens]|uniref:TrmB family transcriptional regulator n=1 Tax=Halarchaeum nitratireducens TaxID=489913 RepID=A0A830G823_9EURY|nr:MULTISPECIES: HTH domain-containing protein [Halarchaeum]MBP2250017.1 putative transcriptional regulator [Halarchaeum solikamskense]GGN09074.1 TrmB family transcriptional regulator [Halarchaeum nitratireducens]
MDLTDSQQAILTALIDGYQSTESPMTGEEIAEAVDRHPGTIRNQMQTLKALDLVEGIPGPRGGYKPTTNAYEALDQQDLDEADAEALTVASDYDRIAVTVERIDFLEVNHPDECAAEIEFTEAVDVEVGDPIVIGPTPNTALVVAGQVTAVEDDGRTVRIDVTKLEAPLVAEP